jgi:hypothetical protein
MGLPLGRVFTEPQVCLSACEDRQLAAWRGSWGSSREALSGVSGPYSALGKAVRCVPYGGGGGAGRKLYVILGWGSGNCFNEMECSLFRTRLAETAMFCSVFLLGGAGHTFPAVLNCRTLGELSKVGESLQGVPSWYSSRSFKAA